MRSEEVKKQGPLVFLQKKGKGRLWLLLGGLLLGVLLLLFGSGAFDNQREAAVKEGEWESANDLAAYQAALEKEIEGICEAVHGVSSAQAMVTLGSGYRLVYEKDAKGDPAVVGSGSSEAAVYHTLQPPAVIGVGVVCKGGDDPHLQKRLIDLLSTTLGIATNRVCVIGK
ncbi:MAG: hypothetical protein E7585_01705 [Ruminococcaceae bacterium]|nr:hypothetical protein [Oscillospiraceae bacterium]